MAVSSAQLAAMQATVRNSLDQACTIQRKHATFGTYGEPIDNYATLATTVCNLSQPTQAQLQNYDYLIGALSAWQVRLPYGTDVQRDDQLLVTVQGLSRTLRVQVLLAPHSYPVCVHLLASEVI